jgi:hypothetical protein
MERSEVKDPGKGLGQYLAREPDPSPSAPKNKTLVDADCNGRK